MSLETAIPIASGTGGIAITPDGKTAYVCSSGDGLNNIVTLIDVATNTKNPKAISLGRGNVQTVAITPDPAPIAFFTAMVGLSGDTTFFDASSSVTPVGSIVNYAWDFGDGTPILNIDSNQTSHIYAKGTYDVTLTVTNSAGTSTSTTQVFTGHNLSRNGGPSATTTQTIYVAAMPAIVRLHPNSGSEVGGKTVTITGTNFIGTSEVSLALHP